MLLDTLVWTPAIFKISSSSFHGSSANFLRVAWIDIFWTFTYSAYNTVFKILFIASSAYTLYLMINDYKPTQDPNLDTFKVQYLLGASAALGIIFPYAYTPSEVRISEITRFTISGLDLTTNC